MKKIILIATVLLLTICSCSDLFDIDPKTEVKEEELFDSELGFYRALMGVYIKATDASIYGQDLSYGFIDVMSNTYSIDLSGGIFQYAQELDFNNATTKNKASGYWNNLYYMIANCNRILENLDGKESLFPKGNFEIIKAEAKALRAFFHFDILRLYAPAPIMGIESKAIPYVDATSTLPFSQPTIEEVLNRIISDLEDAYSLLKENDPMFTDGTTNSDFINYLADNGFRLGRRFRMNYYVVCGILARVNLYKGDNIDAYKYAKEIYESNYSFSHINQYHWWDDVIGGLFMDYNNNGELSKTHFSEGAITNKLVISDNSKENLYEVNKYQAIDVRYLNNFSPRDNESEMFLNKYYSIYYCYSLFKLSEAYLILAETATENNDDPFVYLNELRTARGLESYPLSEENDDIELEIYKEYKKEFLGEGQLFYYYKRKNFNSINGINERNIEGLTSNNYILPIPEDEYEYGLID